MTNLYKTENWSISEKKYSDYWDIQANENVSTGILKGDYDSFYQHIESIGLTDDFDKIVEVLKRKRKYISGKGADIGSGTMWLSAHVCKKFESQIDKIYSVDYSDLNISKLGPLVLSYNEINPDKIILCKGSFYEMKIPDNHLDFVFMSQAFHHADNPQLLLNEINRVLKKDGFVFMIGELYIPKINWYKCYLNYILSRIISSRFCAFFPRFFKKLKKFNKSFNGVSFYDFYFPPDPVYGDYYYTKLMYKNFFIEAGFNFKEVSSKSKHHLAFILFKD